MQQQCNFSAWITHTQPAGGATRHVADHGSTCETRRSMHRFSEPSPSPEGQFRSRMEVIDRVSDGVKYRCSLSVDPPISF